MFFAGVIAIVLVSTGREILYPVATVILGGLVSSTLLDLFRVRTSFRHNGRTIERQFQHTYVPNQIDEDDHGLPPAGTVEVCGASVKDRSTSGLFDGATNCRIDS
jgi:hypothetical protein